MSGASIFANLEGMWLFDRKIVDDLQPRNSGIAFGTMTFKYLSDGKYLCTESGRYVAQTHQNTFTQQYIYTLDFTTGGITVYKAADQKPVIPLYTYFFGDLNNKLFAASTHSCNNDTYSSAITFAQSQDSFKLTLDTHGPAKSYSHSTFLRRHKDEAECKRYGAIVAAEEELESKSDSDDRSPRIMRLQLHS